MSEQAAAQRSGLQDAVNHCYIQAVTQFKPECPLRTSKIKKSYSFPTFIILIMCTFYSAKITAGIHISTQLDSDVLLSVNTPTVCLKLLLDLLGDVLAVSWD